MKQRAKELIQHPLISGILIVISGNMFANFINFLFSVYMAQNLQVAENGILQSVMSMIIFPALLTNAVNPVVVKFAGSYFVKEDYAYLRGFYIKFTQFFVLVGTLLFLLYLINLSSIGSFFHIPDKQILLYAGFVMFLSLVGITNISFIQAKLAFKFQVGLSVISACSKLFFGILFLYLGYSIVGAIGAIAIAAVAYFLVSFYPLKFVFYRKIKAVTIDTREILQYGIPSVLTLFGLTSFISADILLVKHLFNPDSAGLYAGLSLVGRIIFFVISPIGSVMFPIVVRKLANQEEFSNTFKLAMLFVLVPAILLTIFYTLFPEFTLMFFLKKQAYLTVAPLLSYFALYISFYSVLYMLATFYLSIKKTKVYIPIILAAILQIVLISLYHQSFYQIITISFTLVLLLVIGFLLYYPYATKR